MPGARPARARRANVPPTPQNFPNENIPTRNTPQSPTLYSAPHPKGAPGLTAQKFSCRLQQCLQSADLRLPVADSVYRLHPYPTPNTSTPYPYPSQAGNCRHPPWAPPGVRGAACEGQTHHCLTKCPPHPPPRCAHACTTGGNGRRRRGAGAPTVPRTGDLLPLPGWRTRRGLRAWWHPGCTARGGARLNGPRAVP